jgi:hypothetical protein
MGEVAPGLKAFDDDLIRCLAADYALTWAMSHAADLWPAAVI